MAEEEVREISSPSVDSLQEEEEEEEELIEDEKLPEPM